MKAQIARITEPGKVELVDATVDSPASGQLLLKAEYSSISPGTEHALMAGNILPLPQNIGYSMAARVIDIGASVTDYQVGDRVVATAQHASYQLVDQRLVTPVPKGVASEQAAFFNLGHTAMFAIRQSKLQMGEACLVMGQGLVGALTAQLAKICGALPVVVTEVADVRLKLAKQAGLENIIDPVSEPDALAEIIDRLGIDGFPVIFDATGMREQLGQAMNLVGERGRVVMMSQGDEGLDPQSLQKLMLKGARLIGGYVNAKPFSLYRDDIEISGHWPPEISRAQTWFPALGSSDQDIRVFLRLIQEKYLDLSPLISHRFNCAEIPLAYQQVWQKSPALLAGLIDWRD